MSVGGRGDLRDWELGNRPSKGFRPRTGFFAIRAELPTGESATRVAEGPLPPSMYEGAEGSTVPHAGLPRFAAATCELAYPFTQVHLREESFPVDVSLLAFNPLAPPDTQGSSHPVALMRYEVFNPTLDPVVVSVCGSLENFLGSDVSRDYSWINANRAVEADGISGVLLETTATDSNHEMWGTVCLAVLNPQSVSRRTSWLPSGHFFRDDVLDFWDDFAGTGEVHERHSADAHPVGSVSERRTVAPGERTSFEFVLSWHFPNRKAWSFAAEGARGAYSDDTVGNHYATTRRDAWDAALQFASQLDRLEHATVEFVAAICDSTIPESFKEAALFNLSTLKSQTCFRTADGHFFGWEGTFDDVGSCAGSCTHVWNYEQATGFLFSDLSQTMRRVEFGPALDARGLMSFRVGLPLTSNGSAWQIAAADGQMGCLVKLYRDWQLSGDDGFLKELWPAAKSALEFAWIPGGWDADMDGVMEGCQHNTLDVDYYGPNPHMACWYLAALKATAAMARYLGDREFAATCEHLAAKGRDWVDQHLWNGEYYVQDVRPPGDYGLVARGLRSGTTADLDDPANPPFQVGHGCAIDQVTGQAVASLVGLGTLLDEAHLRSSVDALMRYNRSSRAGALFNHMRSFVLGDETGVVIASYPHGDRPDRPSPYFTEVMTGYEYTLALGALYLDRPEIALTIVDSIRERYDGEKRSPLDEAECGHHYARAMAAWGLPLAVAGFHYSAVTGQMRFHRSESGARWVWSTGGAWGQCIQQATQAGGLEVTIVVGGGAVGITSVCIGDEQIAVDPPGIWSVGSRLHLTLPGDVVGGQEGW